MYLFQLMYLLCMSNFNIMLINAGNLIWLDSDIKFSEWLCSKERHAISLEEKHIMLS